MTVAQGSELIWIAGKEVEFAAPIRINIVLHDHIVGSSRTGWVSRLVGGDTFLIDGSGLRSAIASLRNIDEPGIWWQRPT